MVTVNILYHHEPHFRQTNFYIHIHSCIQSLKRTDYGLLFQVQYDSVRMVRSGGMGSVSVRTSLTGTKLPTVVSVCMAPTASLQAIAAAIEHIVLW